MMQKQNPENERIKRKFFAYLQGPLGRDEKTIQKHADAIAWFERTTGHKSFKKFHIEQAVKFRTQLQTATNTRTGKPLTASTMDGQVRMLKAFFVWLSQEHGYKRRINHTDAEYFNLSRAERRIAHTPKRKQVASLQQCKRAFDLMPSATLIQRRDKALFACFMLTGIRDGAAASLPLSCVDLDEGLIYQDARLMHTKAYPATYWLHAFDPTKAESDVVAHRWTQHEAQSYAPEVAGVGFRAVPCDGPGPALQNETIALFALSIRRYKAL